jgi:hypothetical protein
MFIVHATRLKSAAITVSFAIISCGGAVRSRPDANADRDASAQWSDAPASDAANAPLLVPDANTSTSDAAASIEASPESGGGSCWIDISTYDQSCAVDSDCVYFAGAFAVASGNYCSDPAPCNCVGGAISLGAANQYVADVSKTPVGSGAIPRGQCSCGIVTAPPCCLGGRCNGGDACVYAYFDAGVDDSADDAFDAGVDDAPEDATEAGPVDGSVLCSQSQGVLDADVTNAGPTRWCQPPESCMPFNGNWACCTPLGEAGLTFCVVP